MEHLQEWIELINKYTKALEEKLAEIKGTSGLKEKNREIACAKANFGIEGKLGNLKRARPDSVIGYVSYLDEYEKLLKELEDLDGEMSKKFNGQKQKEQRAKEYGLKISHCSYCKNKPPANHYIYSEKNKILKPRKRNAYSYKNEYLFCSNEHFEKWHKKNYFSCAECLTEKWDGKYKKSKKDGQKFCSDNCFYTHYAEKCDSCWEKCVISYQGKATAHAQTYYRDKENKTGILCSKCHQEQLKEEAGERKKDKEWEEIFKRIDKNMDDLVEGVVEMVKGKDDENLDNSEINDKDSKEIENNNKDNNFIVNHREREQFHSPTTITFWNHEFRTKS